MRAEEYLNIVTEQIRCKMARGAVWEEMQCHIEDQKEAFIVEGMSEEEAEEAAVKEMGDPVAAGNDLDRIHRPKMDWKIITLIGVLGIVGLILQYQMQYYFANYGDEEINIRKQFLMLFLSFGVMIGVCYWDYSRIAYFAKEIMGASIVLLLLGTKFFGLVMNGAAHWIYIFGIGFNARMLILLLVPLYGAMLYSWRGQGYRVIAKAIYWMLPEMLIAFYMPSMITVILLFLSFIILLTLAIAKNWYKVAKKPLLIAIWSFVLLLPVMATGATVLWGADYQKARILAFMGRSSGSYQVQMVRTLLEGSHWIGAGERPADQIIYLSDYVLTYAISYYGILAAAILVGLIGLVFLRLFRVSLRQKNGLGIIMGAGCSTVLFLQLVFYLFENLGGLPMSTYCPFLTYGGTGMVVTYILMGLLLSIYRYENVISEDSIRKRRHLKITIE